MLPLTLAMLQFIASGAEDDHLNHCTGNKQFVQNYSCKQGIKLNELMPEMAVLKRFVSTDLALSEVHNILSEFFFFLQDIATHIYT